MNERASAAEPPTKIEASAPKAPAGGINFRRDAAFFLIAASIFALDQITKVIVRASLDRGEAWPDRDWVLNIVNISNSGAAFGILQGQTFFLIGTSIVGVAAIFLYYMFPPLEHGLLRAGLALQLGGAAGNMSDRIRTGRVTDFVNFDYWPTFNIADASISIGVATILVFFLLIETDRLKGPPEESSD